MCMKDGPAESANSQKLIYWGEIKKQKQKMESYYLFIYAGILKYKT